jgi:hypothetical protein
LGEVAWDEPGTGDESIEPDGPIEAPLSERRLIEGGVIAGGDERLLPGNTGLDSIGGTRARVPIACWPLNELNEICGLSGESGSASESRAFGEGISSSKERLRRSIPIANERENRELLAMEARSCAFGTVDPVCCGPLMGEWPSLSSPEVGTLEETVRAGTGELERELEPAGEPEEDTLWLMGDSSDRAARMAAGRSAAEASGRAEEPEPETLTGAWAASFALLTALRSKCLTTEWPQMHLTLDSPTPIENSDSKLRHSSEQGEDPMP